MSDMYEALENLGPAHPSQVSVTVAEATERELRGIPLAISGDPVPMDDVLEREWLRNNPGQPSPFDPDDQALLAHAHLQGQHALLRCQELREGWIPVGETAAAPVVETEAAVRACLVGHDKSCARAHFETALLVNHCLELVEAAKVELNRLVSVVLENNSGTRGKPNGESESCTIVPRDCAAKVHAFPVVEARQGHVFYLTEESIRQLELLLNPAEAIDDPSHKTSPSVGAPDGALRDNSNPTEGDPNHTQPQPDAGLWPAPPHQALTDSFAAIARVQRRLTIGGVLQCRGDNTDARPAS